MTQNQRVTISSAFKTYDAIKAVNDVSFSIDAGECVALVGPNGAGKSTLFKLILGLIPLSKGQIKVLGREQGSSRFDTVRKNIGFLPEQVLFQGSLTGRETLTFYSSLKGENTDRIDDLFQTVELVEAADRRVATYSKGMRQRLGLAQALIGQPEILILDEPTSGLDPASRGNFFEIIEAVKETGAAILMSSHALTELEARTDRVAILNQGKLAALGTIGELIRDLSLSSRIKIKAARSNMEELSKQFSDRYSAEKFANGVAVLECREDQKMSLLKDLMGSDIALESLEFVEPTLEHVFSVYTSKEKSQ